MTDDVYRYPRGHIALMTRAPVEGEVKTRLAAAIGPAQALQVHLELLAATLDAATRLPLAPVSIRVAGDPRHPLLAKLARRRALRLHRQGDGDLGERMAAVFDQVLRQAGFCVLIGSDCPPLTAEYLNDACAALAAGRDLVLGPAEDGGYVLIGLRAPQPALFEAMPWGSARVAERTLAAARASGLDCHRLPVLWDLDRVEDLRRYRGAGAG